MSEQGVVAPWHARVVDGLHRAVVDERDGPLPAMLVALTVLAGIVDACSILRLGHVFVATVTGNLVFVGLAIAGAKEFAIVPCLLSIGGFIAGALAGGHACRGAAHRGRALRSVLDAKLVLATLVTALAVTNPHPSLEVRDAMVVLLAMSMGHQLAAIRFLKVPDLPTVVLTLTLTGVLVDRGLGPLHPAVLRRALALVAFAAGAVGGGLLVLKIGLDAGLAAGLAVIVVVTITAHRVATVDAGWTGLR